MHLKTKNVNTAFHELVKVFHTRVMPRYDHRSNVIVYRQSRNGPVIMIEEPVTITYTHPNERVLFNPSRDANPFFHLYEALWMLAGRNDVEPLSYYVSKMRDYSDDGKTLNGAYGYRWRTANASVLDDIGKLAWHRQHGGIDQLDLIVNHLKTDPHSRRAVLQMWNVEDDLLKIGMPCNRCPEYGGNAGVCPHCKNGLKMQSKDVCCNLSVMFSIRENVISAQGVGKPDKIIRYLDITVISRSEDLIWGLLGADYVDFTILQEYMATRLGCELGLYHHVINNLHVYEWNWKPEKWLEIDQVIGTTTMYDMMKYQSIPLMTSPEMFERELPQFVELYKDGNAIPKDWNEPFFELVAQPMMAAYAAYKNKGATSLMWANRIQSDDWRCACIDWLERRLK